MEEVVNEKIKNLKEDLDKNVLIQQSQLLELKNYKNELYRVVKEIEYLEHKFNNDIITLNNNYEKYFKQLTNNPGLRFWFYRNTYIREIGVLKRTIQNLEEYSRRFRNSFKTR